MRLNTNRFHAFKKNSWWAPASCIHAEKQATRGGTQVALSHAPSRPVVLVSGGVDFGVKGRNNLFPNAPARCYNHHKSKKMGFRFIAVRPPTILALLTAFALSACEQQKVILIPKENDLVVLNGCVISACNYLAVVETQHSLEANFWAKILLVRYKNHPAGHAYCVWETEGTIYGYDRAGGSFPIPSYTRDPVSIASALATGLSKSLNEPLVVAHAEFIEPHKTDLYKF